MSVFKKIKDVLFDIEDDEDTSVSRETTTKVVKENNPIKEVKMPVEDNHDDEISSEMPKKNNSFNFPLDFDDDLPSRSDKSSVEPKKNTYNKVNNDLFDDDFDVPRRNRGDYIVKETDYNKKEQPRDYSKFLQPKKEEKKIFRPSPVISPVYGVLNQNYTKDDVIVKTDTGVKSPTLEDVRKKVYEKQKEEENKMFYKIIRKIKFKINRIWIKVSYYLTFSKFKNEQQEKRINWIYYKYIEKLYLTNYFLFFLFFIQPLKWLVFLQRIIKN